MNSWKIQTPVEVPEPREGCHSADTAAWFYRVVELDDGTWDCRHGRSVIDAHESFEAAFEHINGIASEDRPSRVFVHRRGKPVVVAGEFD